MLSFSLSLSLTPCMCLSLYWHCKGNILPKHYGSLDGCCVSSYQRVSKPTKKYLSRQWLRSYDMNESRYQWRLGAHSEHARRFHRTYSMACILFIYNHTNVFRSFGIRAWFFGVATDAATDMPILLSALPMLSIGIKYQWVVNINNMISVLVICLQ